MKFGKNELNLIFIIFYFLKLKAFLEIKIVLQVA